VLAPEKLLARAKKHPTAVELLRLAVKLHPGTPALWQALAAREREAGDAKAAQAALEQVKTLSTPAVPGASTVPLTDGLSSPAVRE
jgi:predicted Zn-dependent protease